MADRPLHRQSDDDLGATLRRLEPAIAWPSPAPTSGAVDIAAAVRARIEATAPAGAPSRGGQTVQQAGRAGAKLPRLTPWSWRPARRALVLALVALLAVAAIVGAVGLGLPGLRLILGETPTMPPATGSPGPTSSQSPLPGPLGSSMGLGEALDPLDPRALDARAGFAVRLPTDRTLGPPDAAYVDDATGRQVTLVWATRPGLPATLQPDVGLLLSQFRGTVDEGFFNKVVGAQTTVERVRVAGHGGFWLHGDPHVFFWQGPGGVFVDDPRRWVGDVLLWSDGPITYRLETSLGRDAAIRIAETLP